MERIDGRVEWKGKIGRVRVDRFRYDDGEEAEREIVEHPGAVGVVARDGERLYLVKQPREPVNEPALLELPAGKLDEEGESPLDTAQRELAEETGLTDGTWRQVAAFYTTPGFCRERMHLFLAEGVEPGEARQEADEAIELVAVPAGELRALVPALEDAKTIAGLLLYLQDRELRG